MADRDFPFNVNVGEERSFVVNAECEDPMLVGQLEGGAIDGAVDESRDRLEVQAVEG